MLVKPYTFETYAVCFCGVLAANMANLNAFIVHSQFI